MNDKENAVEISKIYARLLATISSIDDNVGRVLDYLEENDLEDNTLVVYTSDQGFYLGEHGGMIKDLFMMNLLKLLSLNGLIKLSLESLMMKWFKI